jgi:Domain of unknown function (DUF384)
LRTSQNLIALDNHVSRERDLIMRKGGVYPVIRRLHEEVDDEEVKGTVERLVNVLMRDEEKVSEVMMRLTRFRQDSGAESSRWFKANHCPFL